MNILVTGSAGFVGRNLIETLMSIKYCKDRTHKGLVIDEIYEFDINTDISLLDTYCQKADFVFNLAGVNRPKEVSEFMKENFGFASKLLETLEKYNNKCPIMLSSSIQATLLGRFANSKYGQSKLAGEKLFLEYGRRTGARVLVYRFPNLFGKWCKPNYNSVIATFCYNIANDLPIQINDPTVELELLYIDDLIEEFLNCLLYQEHRCYYEQLNPVENANGDYCFVPLTYKITLGEIVGLLNQISNQHKSLIMPEIPKDSFVKKLYSTYLSYLPKDKMKFELQMNCDNRGSFTELLKTQSCGQFSVNISKPGITKGQHWHHSKWEFFIVVSGHGLIQERKIGLDENGNEYPVINFDVSGEKIEAIHMLPGYTHNIINLSDTENLVTIMWANEQFESSHPDTYFEIVDNKGKEE